MTWTLVKLNQKLALRNLKSNPSEIVFDVLIWIYAIGAGVGFGGMAFENLQLGGDGWQAIFGLLLGVFLYWVWNIMMPSAEDQLEPERLMPLPLVPRQLAGGLVLVHLLTSRGLLVVVNSLVTFGFLATGSATSGRWWLIPLWFLAVAGSMVFTILGADSLKYLLGNTGITNSRKLKLIMGAGLLVSWMALVLLPQFLDRLPREEVAAPIVRRIGWLPPVAPAGAVSSLALGNWGQFLAQVLIAVASVAALVWGWWRLLQRAYRELATSVRSAPKAAGKGFLVRPLPATPIAAIASLELRYTHRDSRRTMQAIMALAVAVMFTALSILQDNPFMLFAAGSMVVLNVNSQLANVIGMDGPSNWVHITANVSPKQLLLSRVLGVLIKFVPFALLWSLFTVCVSPAARAHFGVILGLVFFGMAAMVGVALAFSVLFPNRTMRPGSNPMRDRSGTTSKSWLQAFLVLGAIAVIFGPPLVLVITGWELLGILVLLAVALVLSWGGFAFAQRELRRTWPDIFQKVKQFY